MGDVYEMYSNYDASVPLLYVLIVLFFLCPGPHWPVSFLLYNQYRDRLLFPQSKRLDVLLSYIYFD